MSLAAALFAPLLALLAAPERAPAAPRPAHAWPALPLPADAPVWSSTIIPSVLPEVAEQVRIERRVIIRITPRSFQSPLPDMRAALPERAAPPRMVERKMGKCLATGAIAGVRPDGANRLILYTRDRRMIAAQLDRTCRARDFYSGFYLSPHPDGRICVDRDALHSRSGATCTLSRLRQLVPDED